MVERLVLLRTIDSLWVEHLTELDDMRRGIGLRGYAQQDPLNEYRREAFRMYEEFRDLIRHQVASSIFRVTVQMQPAGGGDPAGAAQMAAGIAALSGARAGGAQAGGAVRASGTAAAGAAAAAANPSPSGVRNVQERLGDGPATNGAGQARPGYTPTGERIGRNDPCWCGSGNKYKKCHGR
jgi:preprotein translocase subunit SecA